MAERDGSSGVPVGRETDDLLGRFRQGDRVALARAISLVEDERPGFQDFLHAVLQKGLTAARVGLTGPPGAGKSTLLAALARRFREAGETVGVVAVDPSSPYSGGAVLGDRIRMNDLATDTGLFIRSMATRGSLGGLATTTGEVVDLMDAFGLDRLLVETVGVGQTELAIAQTADTVVVVLTPESGDGVQALKAGLMEIADLFAVNKADRPGAEGLVRELRAALHLKGGAALRDVPRHRPGDGPGGQGGDGAREGERASWVPPIVTTVATDRRGIDELLTGIEAHRRWLGESGEAEGRRQDRTARRIRAVVERRLQALVADASRRDVFRTATRNVEEGRGTPYSEAEAVLRALGKAESP